MVKREQLKDISYGEEDRKAKTHWDGSETSSNAIKTQVIHNTASKSILLYFFPYFELFCTIVIFP